MGAAAIKVAGVEYMAAGAVGMADVTVDSVLVVQVGGGAAVVEEGGEGEGGDGDDGND